jgi:hypothetical protein
MSLPYLWKVLLTLYDFQARDMQVPQHQRKRIVDCKTRSRRRRCENEPLRQSCVQEGLLRLEGVSGCLDVLWHRQQWLCSVGKQRT